MSPLDSIDFARCWIYYIGELKMVKVVKLGWYSLIGWARRLF
jgi:hypothetical protein